MSHRRPFLAGSWFHPFLPLPVVMFPIRRGRVYITPVILFGGWVCAAPDIVFVTVPGTAVVVK